MQVFNLITEQEDMWVTYTKDRRITLKFMSMEIGF
jgi:hypothetical protein